MFPIGVLQIKEEKNTKKKYETCRKKDIGQYYKKKGVLSNFFLKYCFAN